MEGALQMMKLVSVALLHVHYGSADYVVLNCDT